MERIQSLAEYLGIEQAAVPGGGVPHLEDIADAKEFARAVLASREFRSYIVNALTFGELPPAITCRLMDHAWGKPTQRIDIDERSLHLEDLTPEVLEGKLERVQRMLRLVQAARVNDAEYCSELDEDPKPIFTPPVH